VSIVKGAQVMSFAQKDMTDWITKYCFNLKGDYVYPSACIIALKGGMLKEVAFFL
jgi:hypothetical protein